MPLSKKGKKTKKAIGKTYGKKKGEQAFYDSKNEGKIKGVEKRRHRKRAHGNNQPKE